MSSTVFLVLRRMRAPLIVLIVIYSVSILGLTLVPGVDAQGRPAPPMNVFHAFYFISYTATTIGFGELPGPFSDSQRLWVTICIYLTVIGYSYSIVTILTLLQEKAFRSAMAANQFARRVRRISEPFYLICGAGATGTLVARSLAGLNRQCVIIEKDELRVQELDLEDLSTNPPMLAGDARLAENLLLGGLRHPQCHGVLALTNDDQANLAIAIAARLLNPEYPVLARTSDPLVAANMTSFGTDHVIDAFAEFADELALSIAAPDRYRLLGILTGLPGEELPEPYRPPAGSWIVCGYGRFGRAVVARLAALGIEVTLIDPVAPGPDGVRLLTGQGSDAATLRAAGVASASGIVAATDSDVDNLSIAMSATELNPGIFVVTRQNEAANTLLFEAYESDFAMVATTIVAEECVATLATPLLNRFTRLVREQSQPWCADLAEHLHAVGQGSVPPIWGLTLDAVQAAAVFQAAQDGQAVQVGDLVRDSTDRETTLPVLALMLVRDGACTVLPDPATLLEAGDQLLFAGGASARRQLTSTVQNPNVLHYVITGQVRSTGWLWRRMTRSVG